MRCLLLMPAAKLLAPRHHIQRKAMHPSRRPAEAGGCLQIACTSIFSVSSGFTGASLAAQARHHARAVHQFQLQRSRGAVFSQ